MTVPFVQTIILALSTIALAVVGRVWRVEEASQVAMLLLIGTGLKIALFDIRSGAAVTMFGTLLVYGGAVLCVARLRLTPSRS